MEPYRTETQQIGAFLVELHTPELESHEAALRRREVEQGLYDIFRAQEG